MIRYVIQLINGEFAFIQQIGENEIDVYSSKNFLEASILSKEDAEEIFNNMKNKSGGWSFYGECVEPKEVRKLGAKLF